MAAHGLGQLAALLIAHIARGGADKLRHRMLFHVLGHIEAHDGFLRAEERFRQGAREFRLADARRAEEEERANGALRVFKSRACAAHRLGDRRHGLLLSHDVRRQNLLKMKQALRLLRGDVLHGDARPKPDGIGDVVRCDRDLLHLAFLPAFLGGDKILFERTLLIAQGRRTLVVLQLDRCVLLDAELLQTLFQTLDGRRQDDGLHARLRRRLVHEVDRLVRQTAVGNVAMRQAHRRLQSLVPDLRVVKRLVLRAQSVEDLLRLLRRRLLDEDALEAPLQRRILLEILLVLLQRRRTDDLHLATRKGRLQDVRGIERAFRCARPDERVHLVDEEDHLAALHDLVDDALQAFLKLTAILRARHESCHRQGHDALLLQEARHGACGDACGKSFRDCRLADARLADEDRIVLRAPRQNLHDALDLLLPADDGVELALPRHPIDVPAVLVEERRARSGLSLRGRGAAAAIGRGKLRALVRAAEHVDDRRTHDVEIGAERDQDVRRHAFILADKPEENVLRADVIVPEGARLFDGKLHHALGAIRVVRCAPLLHLASAEHIFDARAHMTEIESQRAQRARCNALPLVQKPEEDVLRTDEVLLQFLRFVLSEFQHLERTTRKAVRHKNSTFMSKEAPIDRAIRKESLAVPPCIRRKVQRKVSRGSCRSFQNSADDFRPLPVYFILRHVLVSCQRAKIICPARNQNITEDARRQSLDEAEVDAEAHAAQDGERLGIAQGARVVQHAVGAPDLVLDTIFFVEQQSLSRAAFLVYNFTDRDAQIVAKLALRQPQ